MKILVNTPSLKLLGGVANHYEGLKDFWTEDVRYNTIGKRTPQNGSGKYLLPWDIVKFIFKLIVFHPDVVLLNPSLGSSALKRDFIFLRIARLFRIRVALFMHGFNWDYAKRLNKEWAVKYFNLSSLIFVLAKAFKSELESWGVTAPICLSTTKVDDKLLVNYDPIVNRNGNVRNILFLARVVEAKGVFITIDSYRILKAKYPYLRLTIVGDGSDLESVKRYIEKYDIKDIYLTGRLWGKGITNAFQCADVFFLPSYGEGMPTAVLEAMAFGLPVFTRKVGGLPDFFEDGKMGYITDSLTAEDFANALIPYIENVQLTQQVSRYNALYAKEHFMASQVAKRIEGAMKCSMGERLNKDYRRN